MRRVTQTEIDEHKTYCVQCTIDHDVLGALSFHFKV